MTIDEIRARNEERKAKGCDCSGCMNDANDDIDYLLAEVDRLTLELADADHLADLQQKEIDRWRLEAVLLSKKLKAHHRVLELRCPTCTVAEVVGD